MSPILKLDLEEKLKEKQGNGLKKTSNNVNLPCDIAELGDRLRLLWARKKAGNSNVRNEIVAICDELKRKNGLTSSQYSIIINEL